MLKPLCNDGEETNSGYIVIALTNEETKEEIAVGKEK